MQKNLIENPQNPKTPNESTPKNTNARTQYTLKAPDPKTLIDNPQNPKTSNESTPKP